MAVKRRIAGEWGTRYLRLSTHHQLAHCTGGPPREENREHGTGKGSVDHPLQLIPIKDVIIDPVPSSEEKYYEAPVESGGITEVDPDELDKAEERPVGCCEILFPIFLFCFKLNCSSTLLLPPQAPSLYLHLL